MRIFVAFGQRDGIQTLEQSLSELVAAGLVSYDDALARTRHPTEIARAAQPPNAGVTESVITLDTEPRATAVQDRYRH